MKCYYVQTIFQADSGFMVIQYKTKEDTVPEDARIKTYEGSVFFSAKGNNLPNTPHILIELKGTWVSDDKYGGQFKVDGFNEELPTDKKGIIAYLSSSLLKHIGPKLAETLYNRFGSDIFDVLEYEPQRILDIKGITEEKLDEIIQSYQESKSLKDIVSFLSPHGISVAKAKKIKEAFGAKSYEIIKNNPYELLTISGFGFDTVDKIGRKLNVSLTMPLRVEHGILNVLKQAVYKGHLYLPLDNLCKDSYKLLNHGISEDTVKITLIQSAINTLIKNRRIFYDKQNKIAYLYAYGIYEIETSQSIAKMLSKPREAIFIESELDQVQEEYGITLSDKQKEAVRMCFRENIMAVTGGPGTGKTTTLLALLGIYIKLFPHNEVALAAPTGRASRRMAEATGGFAQTLHKTLGLLVDEDNRFINDSSELAADFIIIDESSMVDMYLAHELFSRIKEGAQILLVGDAEQLASVGPGNVFREIVNCDIIPKVRLDVIYRQEESSLIIENSHKINQGITSLREGEDFRIFECDDDQKAQSIIRSLYLKGLNKYDIKDIQILCPRKDMLLCSAYEINQVIRETVNPSSATRRELKIGKRIYREGDRVIQTQNNDQVSNGDIGIIKEIRTDGIVINFESGTVTYRKQDMDAVELSYSITIHKSQGSEYGAVIIPVMMKSYTMLRRNLLYTAVTRAREKVIIVGQREAIALAIKKNDIDQRNTYLGARIVFEYKQRMDRASNCFDKVS